MMLLSAAENLPFNVALLILLGLAVLEGVGALAAFSPSALFDHLLPESPDGLHGALGWLHVGKVPLLVLLILFLFGFAVGGYLIQMLAHGIFGGYLPALLASVPAVFIGLTTLRGLGAAVAYLIPKDESSAVSENSLIGRAGVVITGTARSGMAAEVRVRDIHQHAHYLMLEPDFPEEEFPQGTEVLIVKKIGAIYRGIRNPHPALL